MTRLSIFKKGSARRNVKSKDARGNALFYVLIAIGVLAALTFAVSESADNTETIADYASDDEQISRMLTYSGTIASALNQMVVAGAKGETLYSTLSVLAPNHASFPTAPHNFKLFHPMGGGVNYLTSTGVTTSSDTVATTFKVNPGSIVTGIGPTNAAVGDILFTAVITTRKACQRINYLLTGSTTVPTLATVDYTALFTTGSTVTITAANCPSCVNKAQICVSNTADTAWGFYAALFPG